VLENGLSAVVLVFNNNAIVVLAQAHTNNNAIVVLAQAHTMLKMGVMPLTVSQGGKWECVDLRFYMGSPLRTVLCPIPSPVLFAHV